MQNSRVDISFIQKLILEIEKTDGSIHFVGIGGVSMYSLARLTLNRGISVTGSDREDSPRTDELRLLGVNINIGHRAENVKGASLVVYSHAISADNSELLAAKSLDIPAVSRSCYLGALMLGYTGRIGVSGSHGKSTTVAMLDCIFSHAGCDPTTLSGADLPIGEPVRIGGKSLLIYEACEYRDSFLDFSPTVAIALNLELDHTDYFENIDALKSSFASALGRASKAVIIGGDDPELIDAAEGLGTKAVSFGGSEHNEYRFSITSFKPSGFELDLFRFGNRIGSFSLNIPGVFNVHNATAAITAALEYGIDVSAVSEAIASFRGIPRRLEYIGSRFGRPVYYDYAHHPTEISAAIGALKSLTGRPLTVIFRPHTYSRTKALWREFVSSLSQADYVVLSDIFAARESKMDGINSERLADDVGSRAKYLEYKKIAEYIDLHTRGAIVLMGAGDLEKIKRDIIISK